MSVTLEPVLEALGYRDAHQQRGMVKLLQAAGAYGELPGVRGIIDDKQAQAILSSVTFENTEQAAHWLHEVTQEHFLRRPHNAERHEIQDPDLFIRNRPQLMNALRDTGALAEKAPEKRHYDHVLLLGAMEGTVDQRLDTLRQLWDQGIRFDKIHLLGSERALSPGMEPSVGARLPDGSAASNEMEMMEARYYEKSRDWPAEMQNVRVLEVNAFNKSDGSRANTQDTIKAWDQTHPASGSVLVISNQPYARYQDAAVKSVLPSSFEIDTVGAGAEPRVKVSVAIDSIARQVDVGLPKLLEALRSKNAKQQATITMVEPEKIKVDADTYQFRSGGDKASGVTKKGRYHAEKWDPMLHGDPLLVHERMDGTLYVADGHHRLDFAKETNAKGTGPGKVAVLTLREADGYTARDVKIIAAYRNMAHGHTNPVDAARVFKEAFSGGVHTELLPSLQMDKGNLRLSYSLSKLSDKALDQVEKGEVPAEMAAFVANRVPDDAQRQEATLQTISQKLKQNYTPPAPAMPTSVNVTIPKAAMPEPALGHFAAAVRAKQAQNAGHSLSC